MVATTAPKMPALGINTRFSPMFSAAIPPVIAGGVLIDVAGYKGVDALPSKYAITIEDLEGAWRSHPIAGGILGAVPGCEPSRRVGTDYRADAPEHVEQNL